MNEESQTFGRRLAELMARRDLDAGTVAYRTQLSYNYIYSLIQGRRRNPSYTTLRKLARAIGVTADELVRGTGIALPPRDPAVEELADRLQTLPAEVRGQLVAWLMSLLDLLASRFAAYSAATQALLQIAEDLTEAERESVLDYMQQYLSQRHESPADDGGTTTDTRN